MKHCVKTGIYLLVNELVNKALFLFLFLFNVVLDYGINKINPRRKFFFISVSNDDSLDWKDYGVENIIETVLGSAELKNGAIILLHNGAKYTADALDGLLTELEKKEYQMVPVSKLIYKKGYYLDAAGRQLKKNQKR